VQTITVTDATAPVVSCPPNKTVDCKDSILPANTGSATATDDCSGASTPAYDDVVTPGLAAGCYSIARTWSSTDGCGNVGKCVQTITVTDTTDPVITCPVDKVLACGDSTDPANTGSATATDNCSGIKSITFDDAPTAANCTGRPGIERTWTAEDGCGNKSTCVQNITFGDAIKPVITCPATSLTMDCFNAATVKTWTDTASANDNCAGSVTVTATYTPPANNCNQTVTVTFTTQDACGNPATATKTFTVNDTTAPGITCPKDYYANCGSGNCTTDPEVTGKATATDACSGDLVYGGNKAPTVGEVTYQDSGVPDPNSCQWTIVRTWTATDACGNSSKCYQNITCVPYSQSIVTDSSLCSYDLNPATPCRDFRLLYTPYGSGYKLNASNPGQTFYNVFYVGTPGASVSFVLNLPYPYVTQGANPVHAYDGVTVSGSNPNYCLTPGNSVLITSASPLPVTLASYTPQALNSTTPVVVTLTVPSTGFIYLNCHLDFGLKGTVGLGKGGPSGNDAFSQSNSVVLVPDQHNYLFSVLLPPGDNMPPSDTDGICNMNVFKKNPGVGGRVGARYTLDGVSDIVATPNAVVTLKDAKGLVLFTGSTDQDGWYMLNYKWTGKAATLYVTVKPIGKPAITKTISLKANGFVELNFDVP
jgi:hypothetical protein